MPDPDKFFTFNQPISETELINQAKQAIAARLLNSPTLSSPNEVKDYLIMECADKEIEVFYALFLNAQNQLLKIEAISHGTVNQATVYPREVVRKAISYNASSVMLAHNHPGGTAEPSDCDKAITATLVNSLKLIDVAVLDHFVISYDQVTSFAELGLI